MQTVTRFKANDGTIFENRGDAEERDRLIAVINDATALLLPPVGDRKGYVQQDPAAVLAFKTRLLIIARKVGVYGADTATAETTHNQGMMGRFIDDSGCKPLQFAWFRLQCTDEKAREWEQPFYAINAGTGPDIRLNP